MSERIISVTLIEDDEGMRKALSGLLTAYGYTVRSYYSAESYLERREDAPNPDTMLVDVGLPGISGIQLLEHCRTLSELTAPFIVMSADDDPDLHQRAKAAGGSAFLKKPFPVQDLIAVLRTVTQVAA